MVRLLILIFLLLTAAAFAKTVEFELEIVDLYDPSMPDNEAAKEDLIKNIVVEGGYNGKKQRLGWRRGGGNCGRDVWFCINLPGPDTIEENYINYKKAAVTIAKDRKIRFILPDLYRSDKLSFIKVNEYIDIRYINTVSPEQKSEPIKRIEMCDGHCVLLVTTPISLKFSTPDENYPIFPAEPAVPVLPDDELKTIVDKVDFQTAGFYPPEDLNRFRFSYNSLDITYIKREENRDYLLTENGGIVQNVTSQISVEEVRYAKNGVLFKISGSVSFFFYPSFPRISYNIYFYEDGSQKRYFSSIYEKVSVENGDLTALTEYEKDVVTEYGSWHDLHLFKKGVSYIKYILTAPKQDLQKEFDIYKENFVLLDTND